MLAARRRNPRATAIALAKTCPLLNATSIGRQLSVSWSAVATNYTLWTAPDLSPPVAWQPANNTVQSQINIQNVTVEMTNEIQFFRLRSQ